MQSSRVDDPFDFLRWIGRKQHRVSEKISALVDGKPFQYDSAVSGALKIIEEERFLPDTFSGRVAVLLEFVAVENCSGKQLDLVYKVYSSQIPRVLSGTPESRRTDEKAPQETAGVAEAGGPVQFFPEGGFDRSDRLFGGGRVKITAKRFPLLRSFTAEGTGSTSMRFFSASLGGSADSQGWLAHAQWELDYLNSSLPSGAGELKRARLSGQFSGATKAFWAGDATARFGGLIEGGNLQSGEPSILAASNTTRNAGYGALKFYAGLNSRLRHNVVSISYGIELGSTGANARIDWRKHVGDVVHQFWYTVGDHRPLEIESRFTAGGLQVPGVIPLPERFFGGNREEPFIPGETWRIAANPMIRAIPANRFFRTAEGPGGADFFSYSLTAAYAVWRQPIVPSELANDAKFQGLLNGQIQTATSIEQNYYAAKDQHFVQLMGRVPALRTALAELKSTVAATESARPGQFTAQFRACTSAVNMADLRAKTAVAQAKPLQQYGRVSALLTVDPTEDRLVKLVKACGTDLNGQLNDPGIASKTQAVETIRAAMESEFRQIDQKLAHEKANNDMAFVRRTLDTLFKDLNIYSVSPVAVFDIARIGPAGKGFGGTRYGPGAGIRLELVSAVNFTLGYARNLNRKPGEGSGALFFSIGVRDLFH